MVKKLASQQGITIEEVLNKSLGPNSVDTYYGWKRRGSFPRIDAAYSIAKVLGVSVDYLISGENNDIMPERYKKIISMLDNFNDTEIKQLEIMLDTMLMQKKMN